MSDTNHRPRRQAGNLADSPVADGTACCPASRGAAGCDHPLPVTAGGDSQCSLAGHRADPVDEPP